MLGLECLSAVLQKPDFILLSFSNMHGFLNLIKFWILLNIDVVLGPWRQCKQDCSVNVVKHLGESEDSNLHVHSALLCESL